MGFSKEIRRRVYNKYNGHCAYCGMQIELKDMQVDHLVPKLRNITAEQLRQFNEKYGDVGTDDFENLMPSCRPCNLRKSVWSVEEFRRELVAIFSREYHYNPNFRNMVRYNIIEWKIQTEKSLRFYFEKNMLTCGHPCNGCVWCDIDKAFLKCMKSDLYVSSEGALVLQEQNKCFEQRISWQEPLKIPN